MGRARKLNHYVQIGQAMRWDTIFCFPITGKLWLESIGSEDFKFDRLTFREADDTMFIMYDRTINSQIAEGIAYNFARRVLGIS